MPRREDLTKALEVQFAGVIGKKITGVRVLTEDELAFYGWENDYGRAYAVDVEGGFPLVVSRDEEGNGPGALFLTKDSFAAQFAGMRDDAERIDQEMFGGQ